MSKAGLLPILRQFSKLYEKQDVLLKLKAKEILYEYSCSEIHCIEMIGKIENPNVTKLANELKMTRGAISKITKKQLEKGLIEKYKLENNKKEIYFKLTTQGQLLFNAHEEWHISWEKRYMAFFDKYSEEQLSIIQEFLENYNMYIDDQIDALRNKNNN